MRKHAYYLYFIQLLKSCLFVCLFVCLFSTQQLKKIRGLVLGGAMQFDSFIGLLKLQEGAFKLSVRAAVRLSWFC